MWREFKEMLGMPSSVDFGKNLGERIWRKLELPTGSGLYRGALFE